MKVLNEIKRVIIRNRKPVESVKKPRKGQTMSSKEIVKPREIEVNIYPVVICPKCNEVMKFKPTGRTGEMICGCKNE
jgi:hypothetical protein